MKTMIVTLFRWLDRCRRILVNGLFVLLLVLFAGALFEEQVHVPDDAVLIVNPVGAIVEELALPESALTISAPHQTLLRDLVTAIQRAAADERIQLMVLKLDDMDKTSLAKLQELRRAIDQFKATGKPVIAIGPNYSQAQYFLAADADHIFLNPLGVVGIEGFSMYQNYIKDALAKLHIDVQLFRAGKYKSAVEPLVRNGMSPADRQSKQALLHVLWDEYKNGIAAMRNIKAERLQTVLDAPSKYLSQYDGDTAALAKAEGLVDSLANHGQIEAYIAKAMAIPASEPYPNIDFHAYLAATSSVLPAVQPDQVGIITASGMILDGQQPSGTVGSATMQDMLNRARLDPKIKAVVLRIDSPGGSAQASEMIRSEIVRLKQAGKPVVVSMGSLAASGGYWMAAPADQIWASPSTITGSIGAFGVMANAQRGLEQVGIHSDGLGTTAIAGGIRIDRSLPPELTEVMQLSIMHIYRRFLHVVAQGRHMPIDKVAGLAQGRVWSGRDALRLGLVDALGSFDEAIDAAAKLAGIHGSYSRTRITPPLGLRDMILAKVFSNAETMVGESGHPLLTLIHTVLPTALVQDMTSVSRMMTLTEGKPAIFAMSNLHVE